MTTPGMAPSVERNALYYPYIHIRDINWLKATLLCFRQVRRMVPTDFSFNDHPDVKRFRELLNDSGQPLVVEENTSTPQIYSAHMNLAETLRHHEGAIQRFTRAATEEAFPADHDQFQIYDGKLHENILRYLREQNLAWPARAMTGMGSWYAVHPQLGEAIMSLMAIAIAKDKQLDIVTSSGRMHRSLSTNNEAAVFEDLLGIEAPAVAIAAQDVADELAMMVMTSHFDLSRLTPDQIGTLVRERQDLRAFKDKVLAIAQRIPTAPDPVEREKNVRSAAQEVIEEWTKYRKSLPGFFVDTTVGALDMPMPPLVLAALGAASGLVSLAAAGGLAIGCMVWKGRGLYRTYKEKTQGPTQFLSKVVKTGGVLVTPPVRSTTSDQRLRS